MDLQVNNASLRDQYLRGLNICFRGWGGQSVYAWVFERHLQNCPATDQLVLLEDGDPVAGSAITYREVILRTGKKVLTGIMTGSWTLPEARGRGCFSRLVKESVQLSSTREAVLLLAFVTQTNPSWRRLAESGAVAFPACYLLRSPGTPAGGRPTGTLQEIVVLQEDIERWLQTKPSGAQFQYSVADWASQFIKRPVTTLGLRCEDGSWAIIERQEDTDRLLFSHTAGSPELLIGSLAEWTASQGRKLFAYSSDKEMIRLFAKLGFEQTPGFLTAHLLNAGTLAQSLGVPETPAPDGGAIADPASPWYLGDWQLQAGDRM